MVLMVEEEFNLLLFGIKKIGLVLLLALLFLKILDVVYTRWFKRPAWVHFYLYKVKLSEAHKLILRKNFNFYNRLSNTGKRRFEHRLQCFIDDKEFIPRQDFVLGEDKKVLIAATAVMLTFGMRRYMLPILEKIIVYPTAFYSTIDKRYHKGEFNPRLKALVLSWEDFEEGYRIEDDNLNLGIHEFTHAIHLNSMKRTDTASVIFSDGFSELLRLLRNESLVIEIKKSGFIRAYAFTNEFEFLAVVLENFIESPTEFKSQFPSLYKNIQQMFNFRFAGY